MMASAEAVGISTSVAEGFGLGLLEDLDIWQNPVWQGYLRWRRFLYESPIGQPIWSP